MTETAVKTETQVDIKNAQGQLLNIPLEDLVPTQDNPRTVLKKTDPKIQSLAASIKSKGQRQPASARPHPKKKGKYDLRTGARRYLACQVAGIPTLLVRVRDMDDKEALEETILENVEREDLTPFEYARSINALLESKWSAADIADRYDKSERWVYSRARLTTLIPEIIQSYEDPEDDISKWPITYLEAIVVLPPDCQKTFIENANLWRVDSLKDLQQELNNYMRILGKAKWDLTDENLVKKAGPCSTCEFRASHTPMLFEDEPDLSDLKKDRCLNAGCWEKKEKAWLKIRETELREKHPDLVKISSDWGNRKGLSPYQYDKAKKTTKGAVPAMNTKTGSLTYVTLSSSAKESIKEKEKKDKPPTLRALRKELSQTRKMWIACKIKKNLGSGYINDNYSMLMKKGPEPAEIKEPDLKTVLAVVLAEGDVEDLKKYLKYDIKKLTSKLWKTSYGQFSRNLRTWDGAESCHKEAEYLAGFFGIDFKALEKAAADIFPEPEEWKNLKADGTPKEDPAKKKAAKKKSKKNGNGKKKK